MAKRGLGRGLDALMNDSMPDMHAAALHDESAQEATDGAERAAEAAAADSAPLTDARTAVASERDESAQEVAESVARDTTPFPSHIPAGITVDESGQLWVDVARLKPNPHQPRQAFDEEKLCELADSIRAHGIIESIIVEDAGDDTFYIIAGERRTRAARMAGMERVPVQVRRYSEQKKLEVALIENIQRADLNAIEEAQAYYKLMELGGLSQEQVAARVGKNRSTVANAVRLLKLPEDMQAALAQGRLTAGHARALLAVNDSADQRVLFGKILGSGMSVRQAETAAAELNAGGGTKTANPVPVTDTRDPDFAALEGQFRDALGTKVVIKGDMERGTLVIDYFSRADLDRLYDIFTRERPAL